MFPDNCSLAAAAAAIVVVAIVVDVAAAAAAFVVAVEEKTLKATKKHRDGFFLQLTKSNKKWMQQITLERKLAPFLRSDFYGLSLVPPTSIA